MQQRRLASMNPQLVQATTLPMPKTRPDKAAFLSNATLAQQWMIHAGVHRRRSPMLRCPLRTPWPPSLTAAAPTVAGIQALRILLQDPSVALLDQASPVNAAAQPTAPTA
jgi:hypothetical protein